MSNYYLALLVTIAIESMVLWLFLRRGPHEIVFFVTLITCCTLPIATYFYQNTPVGELVAFSDSGISVEYPNAIYDFLAIEIGVVFAESGLIAALFELRYNKAWLYSLAANITTASLALVVFGT